MDSNSDLSPEKRAQILSGAAVIFAAQGYEGASMAQIAAAAGVSKGTLYNHFENKAALFVAYVSEKCQERLASVFHGMNHDGGPEAVLREVGKRMLHMMLSDAGLAIYRVVISEASKFPELASAFFEAGPARAVRSLSEWLEEETRQGRLCVSEPAFAAEQFLNLCQTHLVLRRRLELLADPPEAYVDRVVDAAIGMFLARYGVNSGA